MTGVQTCALPICNTAVGESALLNNTTGNYNTSLGQNALISNTSASYNIAVGHQAAYSTTTGASNTVVGSVSVANYGKRLVSSYSTA